VVEFEDPPGLFSMVNWFRICSAFFILASRCLKFWES
jgi:hypothetical protein